MTARKATAGDIGTVPSSAKRAQPKGGSRKGRPNKSTVAAREAIGVFVDGNMGRLQEWLDSIAEKDGPLAAFRCFTEVIEYHVPKLARTEVTGARGGPIQAQGVQPEPDLSRLSTDELEALATLLAKAAGLPFEDQ